MDIIRITQEHIDSVNNLDYDGTSCPVGQAINQKYPDSKWLVAPLETYKGSAKSKHIYDDGKSTIYKHSEQVDQWLSNFDSWQRHKASVVEKNARKSTKPEPIEIEVDHHNKTITLKGEQE